MPQPEDCQTKADENCDGAADCGARVVQIAAGGMHTCALIDSGSVVCWGTSTFGQLGYGNKETVGDDEHPGSAGFVDIGAKVSRIVAGLQHTCALTVDNQVKCWGLGQNGQLGLGTKNNIGDNEVPASAPSVNLGGGVSQITAGWEHTCALLLDGQVRCWGINYDGVLGTGTKDTVGDDETPGTIPALPLNGNVIQIEAGGRHTCALLDGGKIKCWGRGFEGQLGNLSTETIGDDEGIAGIGFVSVGDDVAKISGGSYHTCVVTTENNVRCWGGNLFGALGQALNEILIGDDELPSSLGVVQIGEKVSALDSGYSSTCAKLFSGALKCWGLGSLGQLGNGTGQDVGDDETPASVGNVDVGGGVDQFTMGEYHACVVLQSGEVRCWGQGEFGQLGYGDIANIGDDELPTSVQPVQVLP